MSQDQKVTAFLREGGGRPGDQECFSRSNSVLVRQHSRLWQAGGARHFFTTNRGPDLSSVFSTSMHSSFGSSSAMMAALVAGLPRWKFGALTRANSNTGGGTPIPVVVHMNKEL